MTKLFVPNEIIRVFKQHYPTVDLGSVEWSWEVPGKIYEAEFDLDDQECEVEITVTGHWLLTEKVIAQGTVPKVVQHAVAEDYADYAVESATHIEYSTGDVAYEFDLKCASTGEEIEVIYREDGWKVLAGADL
ncbi:MAG: hypothetical protein GY810_12430 [Aureispira sp.]|nr:hypothetical protein [Aureispira sp.]